MSAVDEHNKATLLLVSGDLDKALLAFEIAIGFATCGSTVDMWFVLYGINCIKKPKSPFNLSKWFPKKTSGGEGRVTESDTMLQNIICGLNRDGAENLPLSQLNFMGVGPKIFNGVLKKKNMANLSQLIKYAEEVGVNFRICQVCIDAMAINVEQDLLVDAKVYGVSRYAIEAKKSFYNVVI